MSGPRRRGYRQGPPPLARPGRELYGPLASCGGPDDDRPPSHTPSSCPSTVAQREVIRAGAGNPRSAVLNERLGGKRFRPAGHTFRRTRQRAPQAVERWTPCADACLLPCPCSSSSDSHPQSRPVPSREPPGGPGTGSPVASRAAAGTSTPATATTAGCSSAPTTWRGYGGRKFAQQAHRATRVEQIRVGRVGKRGQGWGACRRAPRSSGCADRLRPSPVRAGCRAGSAR